MSAMSSLSPLEAELVKRAAEREGISAAALMRRAIRSELSTAPRGKLNLSIDPNTATALLNKAARMGRRSEELVEALIRDHLDNLTDDQIDPQARIDRARSRARELLAR